MPRSPVWLVAMQLVLGGVFVVSGLGKVLRPDDFVTTMLVYDLLPRAVVPFVAPLLMWTELITGALLVLDAYVKGAALTAAGLLTAFIAAIIIDLQRGIVASCGCFDLLGLDEQIGWGVVARDGVFLALAVALVLFSHDRLRLYGLKGCTRRSSCCPGSSGRGGSFVG
ncbi:MAG: DoxX family membrane protein [Candidatus Riflebacteria bacterium]|nr:DoxX family membrane protein [Candidatus Riflebacteria bacterium]